MSFRHCSQTIPRVSANSIGSPHSATEQATSSFQIGVESVSLALTRHSVVILKLKQDDARLVQDLQDAAAAHFEAQQHPLTPAVAGGHIVLPGCSSLRYRPGSTGGSVLASGVREAAHQAFTLLDSIARMTLHAVCRSCHVRLHQATLDTVLDEQPLTEGVQASSLLQVQQSVVANLSADLDQEAASSNEVLPHGLVSVISAQNALSWDRSGGGEPQPVPASMLQVKDREGKWVNVDLKGDEVAVLLGATLHHCTAGLLRPSLYRVVGDVHAGAGRKATAFELMARPDAALDFAAAMQGAGHSVAPRFLEPLVAQQLSARLTAAKLAHSSAKSSATCVLRSRTNGSGSGSSPVQQLAQPSLLAAAEALDSQPATCRGRKRPADAPPQPSSPIATRSRRAVKGNHRAASVTSGGQAQQPGQQVPAPQRQEPAARITRRRSGTTVHAAAQPAMPSDAEAATPAAVAAPPSVCEGRELHIRVHGIDAEDKCNHLALRMQNLHGDMVHFLTTRDLNLGTLFELFCERMGADLGAVSFHHKGSRVFGFDTPNKLKLGQNSVITVASTVRPQSADA